MITICIQPCILQLKVIVFPDGQRKMAGLIQTHCKHTNLELIGKWKNLEVLSLDLSKGSNHGRGALSIVKLGPNIKYLNLKGAKVNWDGLVTLLH
ncbi:unnamed protein product [Prunus armeniaca]